MLKCEFGDCENVPITEMGLTDHSVAVCSEHKIQAFEIRQALFKELGEKRAEIILRFFKAIQAGGE
ncbi:hypothetical protein LCGC14_1200370 [marine sediment metagenome]|uniref:Uncharacterized protein n=1 Tax=marine sediment metagenome TaxID=412755 RepID=A0A0F9NZH9_9ZZZZ|nr:hypothetical protein [Candidatus Aminicenantes bacterium]